MIGKALVKVTLNEATDPDLFAYIKQFDNERMRAGALRALARAALNGGEARRAGVAAQMDAPLMRTSNAPARQRLPDVTDMVESGHVPSVSSGVAPLAAMQPAELPTAASTDSGARRFEIDAIADQFAGF
jgi:hypothetical protein